MPNSKNLFLRALVNFYKNKTDRKIIINNIIDEKIVWTGKDNAKFNKAINDNTLDEIYVILLKEMEKGFNTICVINEEEKQKIETICRFLCIYPYVKVIVNKGD